MPGNLLSYPFLTDSFTTSFMLGGLSLRTALLISSLIMLALVFAGYSLLCQRLCKTKPGMFIAALLFFINGGFGFVYILDMLYVPLGTTDQNSLQAGTGLAERLWNILEGYSWYQTPTNHAEFDTYNLRWSNVIADMLIPQRTTMGGWSMLMPCLWLLTDLLLEKGSRLAATPGVLKKKPEKHFRQIIILGVMAGCLPLIHTHSFAALGFCSCGMLLYSLIPIIRKRAWQYLRCWAMFQSTRPRGARHADTKAAHDNMMFQSTRPRGARPSSLPRALRTISFNPRAHGGRDYEIRRDPYSIKVSIHAPTGGATAAQPDRRRSLWFQSTRPRGARLSSTRMHRIIRLFQSTRPRGARRRRAQQDQRLCVSIHAPTGGATASRCES